MFLISDACEPSRPALVDAAAGRTLTYAELLESVLTLAHRLEETDGKSLAFCFTRNDLGAVLGYLAAVQAGHAVLLVDADAPQHALRLLEIYQPELLLNPPAPMHDEVVELGYERLGSGDDPSVLKGPRRGVEPHPELAVLLSTSGTTGSPKLVRLTRRNIESNAASIRRALALDSNEHAVTSLPINYSYGLSVLNSHLAAGATITLTNESVLSPAFWDAFRAHECTSFAGVPYSYQILARTGFDPTDTPSLRTMTQAGGKLAPELVQRFWELVRARGRFFVMYGQTEATARMAILPPECLPEKLGSVGLPIAGGQFEIRSETGGACPPGEIGEITYNGPNVMMGYALTRDDLSHADELGNTLATGDLGYLDDDGFLYITGRRTRMSKLYGVRVDLDEVERLLRLDGPVAVVGDDSKLVIFCETGGSESFSENRRALARKLRLHHRAFEFRRVDSLPLSANGKIDYAQLNAEI